ncbi:MAG TPA: hypothetical protein VHX90_02920, partial [Verrucomicrobiae bacterium]|nr:hypothetical protein [Verrucomicrobiae bacterium]
MDAPTSASANSCNRAHEKKRGKPVENRASWRIILAFEKIVRNLTALIMSKKIFIGTDSGATTTKFSAVWENGDAVSTKLLQRPTSSEKGRDAVISGWIAGITEFLAQNKLDWSQVQGVGLAIPGPYESYGVFGKTPNLPASFSGWNVYADYSAALAKQTGHAIPLVVGNDGNYGGVAEARLARGDKKVSVMMLMP